MSKAPPIEADSAFVVFRSDGFFELIVPPHRADDEVPEQVMAAMAVFMALDGKSIASLASEFKARCETGLALQ